MVNDFTIRFRSVTNFALGFMLMLLISSCAKRQYFMPEEPHWRDRDDHPVVDPGKRDPDLIWDYVTRSVFDQVEEDIDFARHYRKLTGSKRQATNINSLDEVPNSSWFQNRHGLFDLTPAEIAQGVEPNNGPDPNSTWTVFRPKTQGVTPGFWIKDSDGEIYIIKFDPKGYPELTTGSNAITSRFFHAVGYNVPHETIVFWDKDILKIKEGLKFEDALGQRREFTQADLESLLDRVERQPDGRFRSLASHLLPNVRGPFSYKGRNKNDGNDWCPHEDRRELRAMKVFCTFVNHWDVKDQNTMDSWVSSGDGDKGYLKHFLIDFGSSMGSAGNGPASTRMGYANNVDWREMAVSFTTLGIKTWQWEHDPQIEHRSIGFFESKIFQPDKWDPGYPIPSFEKMTDRDAFWAAKIIMAFDDEDLQALVGAGQYSDPEAASYMLQTLKERQDKIGRFWFDKVNPLDKFSIKNGAGTLGIEFTDLSLIYGFEEVASTSYRFTVKYRGQEIIKWRPAEVGQPITIESGRLTEIFESGDDDAGAKRTYEMRIQTSRSLNAWSKPVILFFWYHPEQNHFQLVGIEHRD